MCGASVQQSPRVLRQMDGWTPQGCSPVYPLRPDKKMPHSNIQVELIFPENGKKGESENRILVQTVLFFFKHLIAERAARPVARAWQGTLLCLLSHIFSYDLPYLCFLGNRKLGAYSRDPGPRVKRHKAAELGPALIMHQASCPSCGFSLCYVPKKMILW